jgi:hypothetical protein
VDFSELMPDSSLGTEYYTWNGVTHGPHAPGTLSFGFDSPYLFPEEIFDCLAAEFHTLEFHCTCIADMDEFIGEGWYNGPP